MSTYDKLISATRFRPSTVGDRDLVEETESDRGRLLFSAAFRRQAQKTQVFALESSSSVRSRLTHSLEVGYLGRLIAQKACTKLARSGENCLLGREIAFANLVETACLMHDIGNPPFGHFGESAIQRWFVDNGEKIFLKVFASASEEEKETFRREYLPDFTRFDGNAQGFRIVSRLQWETDEWGLNLTLSQLATYLKYPRCTTEPVGERPFQKKSGYFRSEEQLVKAIWDNFGLNRAAQRFPLTYIVEAADDIAYCLGDIEDGLDKGLIAQSFLRTELQRIWLEKVRAFPGAEVAFLTELVDKAWERLTDVASIGSANSSFFSLKTTLTRILVEIAATQYASTHTEILSGKQGALLEASPTHAAALQTLKSFARSHLFSCRDVEDLELAGNQVLTGLLGHLRPLLELRRDDFETVVQGERQSSSGRNTEMHGRLFRLFPSKHRLAYAHAVSKLDQTSRGTLDEWFARAHLVVDYVTGMTDRFALETYQLLSGIRVGK